MRSQRTDVALLCSGVVWRVARLVLARQVCYIICIARAELPVRHRERQLLVWARYKQTQTKQAHTHTYTCAQRTCHGGKWQQKDNKDKATGHKEQE